MLSAILFVTLAGAFASLACLCLPKKQHCADYAQKISLCSSLIVLILALCLVLRMDFASPSEQFIQRVPWIPGLGISYSLGVDGFRALFALLTALLVPIALLTPRPEAAKNSVAFPALFLFLEFSLLGAIFASDLLLFYIFWELMLIPAYFCIGIWGEGEDRKRSTIKFVLYTVVGSLLMLAGIIALGLRYAAANGGRFHFGMQELLTNTPLSTADQILFFALFAIAFLIKVPAFPFHTWLPATYVAAPTGLTLLLSGLMAKLGVYGLFRIAVPMFPAGFEACAPILAALGAFGMVYAGILAWAQSDVKRMLAYSSMSHLGVCILGIAAWNKLSVSAASFQIFSHGLLVAGLFYCLALLEQRFATRERKGFGGLAEHMPWAASCMFILALSSIGLPLTMGFVGEFLALQGAFLRFPWLSAFAVLGIIFSALYMLSAFQSIFFGPLREELRSEGKDFSPRERAILVPICLLAIVLGVFPNLIFSAIESSTSKVLYRTEQRRDALLALEDAGVLQDPVFGRRLESKQPKKSGEKEEEDVEAGRE